MSVVANSQDETEPSLKDFLFFQPRGDQQPISPAFNERHLKTVLRALTTCWGEIESFQYRNSAAFQLEHYHDEDELNTKLVEILNYKLDREQIQGFKPTWFQSVWRDAKQSSATTSSIDQMPDMTFSMVAGSRDEDRAQSGLFVECKLLSPTSGCGEYVINGMARFVSGRYAPRVGYGLMLGYAASDYGEGHKHLTTYFKKATNASSISCKAATALSPLAKQCFTTMHTRTPPAYSRLCLVHMWLDRPV